MDISTGHMVLSYMEDHLKNKQRLEQEWVGLCAYEAEPNSTSIAFKVKERTNSSKYLVLIRICNVQRDILPLKLKII